ncbi:MULTISPECIES: ShlB/FhaC/HecB family hemolysin secretion/activation protein [Vibrio]|uniref:ShlB/FhaC/HecB family hemolysin secretion/activation protein n=1 Tax=Vibrio TaxID=662 RepID=UPI000DE4F2E0|nr:MULTISPECIES: ShlB/FhaC/HecB family hemolysin secretion/activation protein [Vibrio]MDN6972148.1 ShlB/FhaC/HecB family hemolysin secretion/activation protein [Vibrio cholerae]RBM31823.1 ShlB/FhaC/HecB family hemolysin secretion/activation protein [Vibrio tarriae]
MLSIIFRVFSFNKKSEQRKVGVRPRFCVLVLVVAFFYSNISHAAKLPLGPLTAQDIENEQKQRLEQIENNTNALQGLVPVPVISESQPIEDTQCINVREIRFSGNTRYSDQVLTEAAEFKSGCIGLNTINEYLRKISNHYIQAGYITSRAFMTPQDLSSGILLIVIIEGKVEKVLFNGKKADFLAMALPSISGTVLNLRDIEQGLDQINRLSRYNAQIKLLPSARQGYSIVDIQTAEKRLVSVSTGFNNSGQESTGEEQLSVSLAGENFFKLLDQWSLRATKSAAFINSKDSESLYFGLDIPLGYWNFSYRTSYSNYTTTFTNKDFVFDSSGKTNSHDVEFKWLFYRDDVSKSALKTTISHRREKNYILGNVLEAGSRNVSSASLAWDHSTRLGGGFMSLSPKVSLGTDWFGGEKTPSQDDSLPTAQFIKGSLAGSYAYPITPSLSLASTIFAQWSNDTLYGSERLSIGGEYSVRGFKGASISGDEGYYWRNDINYRLGQWPNIGLLSMQVALDTGTIVEDSKDTYEKGSLLGSSVSLQTQAKYVSSSLTFGFPIEVPSRLSADDYVVYYRVDFSI